MKHMFYNCNELRNLDLSGFNTANVMDLSEMFRGCSALRTIYVGDGWRLSDMAQAVSRNVFNDCTSLVGGQGTAYDANHVGADYAHIDGGSDNPGYFTAKPAMRGDINGDNEVNVADVTALIQIILNNTPVDLALVDLNGDSQVNVADGTALIQLVLDN